MLAAGNRTAPPAMAGLWHFTTIWGGVGPQWAEPHVHATHGRLRQATKRSCSGAPRRRLHLHWHHICDSDRTREALATVGLGDQRVCIRGSHWVRTISAPEPASFGGLARSIGRRARSIRACDQCKHPFTAARIG